MRKFIVALAVLAIALAFVPSTAAPLPQDALPNSCLVGGGEVTDGTGTVHCEFIAGSTPHGYVSATPNDFVIWLDANNNDAVNPGETVLAEISPSSPPAMLGNSLTIATGAKVDVALMEGCAGPGCGWIGLLLVG